MSRKHERNNFVLYMFQQDIDSMKDWVLQYPNKETGGDLFGLWSGEGDNAVIHVVLGPGRGCTHGDYHFYQDVNYLEKVGILLTENYMLGHIGEWHSHHQLRLDKPSEGDCRTIQRNYPRGSCGFFLMIANIVNDDEVSFSPYIFKENSVRYRAGYIEKINAKSPFSLVYDVSQQLVDGKEAEKLIAPRNELEKEKHKDKDKVIKLIFRQESMRNFECKKSSFNSSSSSSPAINARDSNVYCVMLPSNSSQWYSRKENHGVIEDIYLALQASVGGEVEITFGEKYLENMHMSFFYHGHKVILSFPNKFPWFPARLMMNERLKDLVHLQNCYSIQSFDLNEFVEVLLTLLQKV